MDEQRKRRNKILVISLVAVLGILFAAVGSLEFLEFMDSSEYCGNYCHEIMGPEYTVYQESPHSNVNCVSCHIGPGIQALGMAKLRGLVELVQSVTGWYDRPIETPLGHMPTAEETCKNCHNPQWVPSSIIRTFTNYEADESNTENTETRVMRIGEDTSEGKPGIHWHVESDVWYLPLDKERQEIVWVGVEDANGQLREYVDPSKIGEVTSQFIDENKRLMDCMDCHSRPAHKFYSPEELIDTAIADGRINKELPYIKKWGLGALDPPNVTEAQALARIEAIREYYRSAYPRVYEEQRTTIEDAMEELKEISKLTTFPEMKVTWETHIDNLGHEESPGCFRCHNTLEATDGEEEGKVIEAGCNSCHYSIQ